MTAFSKALRAGAVVMALAASSTGMCATGMIGEVEVLHFWVSGGEAKSIDALKTMLRDKGVDWKDFALGRDAEANVALNKRFESGNAVTAAHTRIPEMRKMGRKGGILANLDAVAARDNWDGLLPKVVADSMKFQGHYVSAPINVHRSNWLWINTEVFNKAGARIPTTFDEFFDAAEKIKKAGMIAIAHGGEPWQDAIMMQAVALGVGGPVFYEKVFAHLDQSAIESPTMVKVFETLNRMKPYIDKYSLDRQWSLATSMVIHAKGGMQFMGDWAKGEFLAKGKVPGKDFVCVAAPGTANAFIFVIDALTMFRVQGKDKEKAQEILAETVMSPEFQEVFNLNKGSIPARIGIPRGKFDTCAHKSMDDMIASGKSGSLVPDNSVTMTNEQSAVFQSVAAKFLHTNQLAPQAATQEIMRGLRALTKP